VKQLDDQVFVAGQIRPSDLPGLAALGVKLVVNNRPDNEEPGQPMAGEIAAAASAAGIACRHIPVAGAIGPEAIDAMAEALDEAGGRLLAFCRSGTRSTYIWALARARRGADAEYLSTRAAAAGYDLSPIRHHLGRRQGSGAPPRNPPDGPSAGSG